MAGYVCNGFNVHDNCSDFPSDHSHRAASDTPSEVDAVRMTVRELRRQADTAYIDPSQLKTFGTADAGARVATALTYEQGSMLAWY